MEKEGDRIGPKQILFIKQLPSDKSNHRMGLFLCPYEHNDGKKHTFIAQISQVRTGRKSHCGCKNKKATGSLEQKLLKENLTGRHFGRLTVVKPLYVNEKGSVIYLCKCDCSEDSYKEVSSIDLKSGGVKSCGCLAKERSQKAWEIMIEKSKKDLTGKMSGTWTAISRTDKQNKSGNYYWLCRCENGHYHLIDTSSWGKTKTCRQCKDEKQSIGEKVIQSVLEELNINFETEKQFQDCFYKRVLRFDFYLPDYNCCIEYDGIQHFKPTNFSHDNFEERKQRDKVKDLYCKNKGIKLIRIAYTDLDLIDADYIKRRLQND